MTAKDSSHTSERRTYALNGRDIVVVSSIDWDFNWQGHQEIARRLADAGNRVLYIENLGVRAPGLHDVKRVASRFSQWIRSIRDLGVRRVSENLYVCSPLILPPFGSATRHQLNQRVFLPVIRRAVRKLGFKPKIILTFLPTDTVALLIKMLRRRDGIVVYYCIADFAELVPTPLDIQKSERTIIDMSDLVLAQCAKLAEHCSQGGKDVEVFSFGVDLGLFAKKNGLRNGSGKPMSGAKQSSAVNLMSTLPRPVIGYVGGIHKFFHGALLATMARARPEWSWVLVGPTQTTYRELKGIPNIYFVGPRPHEELPDYIRNFDVGIVPYVINKYTATVIPTKINEYLAMGKPVVSTDLPELNAYNDEGIIITSSNDSNDFMGSIERAIDSSGEGAATTRRAIAERNDWKERFEQMRLLMEQKLIEKLSPF